MPTSTQGQEKLTKAVMRWKKSSQILLSNEMKNCHLIRAAQSAAHLPLKGKAVKMSAKIFMERGLLLRGSCQRS